MDVLGINVLSSVMLLLAIMAVVVALVAYLEATTPRRESRNAVIEHQPRPMVQETGPTVQEHPVGPGTPARRKSDPKPVGQLTPTLVASDHVTPVASDNVTPVASDNVERDEEDRVPAMPGPWYTAAPAIAWPDQRTPDLRKPNPRTRAKSERTLLTSD